MAEPTEEQVVAWLAEDSARGVMDAVRHWWDVPPEASARDAAVRVLYDRVRNWQRRQGRNKRPQKPTVSRLRPAAKEAPRTGTPPNSDIPTQASPAPVVHRQGLSELDELAEEIARAEDVRARMETDHSWTPYTAHSRYIRGLREQYRELTRQQAADVDPFDHEQLVAAMLAMPTRVWADRRVLQKMHAVLDVIDASDA